MISKIVVQSGIGLIAAGAAVGGGIAYVLSDNAAEYLVEARPEDETNFYMHKIHEENSSLDSTPPVLDEIKGGNDKNYFCRWNDKTAKQDNKCKLIELDFDINKKSFDLTQIADMNNEIVKSSEYFPEIWFKLKISKNYVFDINKPTKINIVEIGKNNKVFTTVIPKFKISSSPIWGNVGLFLTKLNSLNENEINISDNKNYHCDWITVNKANEIVSSFTTSSTTSIDHNIPLSNCKVHEFELEPPTLTKNGKISEFNLNNTKSISLTTEITNEKLKNYFIIELEEMENNEFAKSFSELLIKENYSIIVYVENIPLAIFTFELPLAIARTHGNNSQIGNLVRLN